MPYALALLVVCSGLLASAAASQTPAGGAAAPRACSVLTRDLVTRFTENPKMLDLIPANEEPLGTSGSACDWGGVRLQLFPIPKSNQKRNPQVKGLQPVSGAGEAAFFRSNRDRYAELMVYTATHYLTLQVDVPSGGTAEAIKPDTIVLANAIIAKLR